MPVTEEQRTTLSRELDRALGNEAAVILMAHLPVGGAQTVATREDIDELRQEMRDGLARCATKDDLQRFATKDDLRRFATKEDLLGMARRQELELLRARMDDGFAEQQRFNLVVLDRFGALEGRMSGLEVAMQGLGDTLRAEFRAAFRGGLIAGITAQTRTLLLALMTTVLAVSGLAIGLVTYAQP